MTRSGHRPSVQKKSEASRGHQRRHGVGKDVSPFPTARRRLEKWPKESRVGANGMGRGPCRLGPFRPQHWGQMRKKVTEITDTAGPPQSKCLAQDNKSWTGQ